MVPGGRWGTRSLDRDYGALRAGLEHVGAFQLRAGEVREAQRAALDRAGWRATLPVRRCSSFTLRLAVPANGALASLKVLILALLPAAPFGPAGLPGRRDPRPAGPGRRRARSAAARPARPASASSSRSSASPGRSAMNVSAVPSGRMPEITFAPSTRVATVALREIEVELLLGAVVRRRLAARVAGRAGRDDRAGRAVERHQRVLERDRDPVRDERQLARQLDRCRCRRPRSRRTRPGSRTCSSWPSAERRRRASAMATVSPASSVIVAGAAGVTLPLEPGPWRM